MNEDTQKLIGHLLPSDVGDLRDSVHIAIVALTVGEAEMQPGSAFFLAHGTTDVARPARPEYGGPEPIGIIDPFLRLPDGHWAIEPGRRVLGFLYPGTVTGMRHHWSHPAFDRRPPTPATRVELTGGVSEKERDREAFLRGLAERPDDEMAHKIYADWLDEQGEHREAARQRDWSAERQRADTWLHEFAERWNFDFDEMIAQAQHEDGYAVARGIDLHGRLELAHGDEDLFWQHLETLTGLHFSREHQENFGWSCSC